MADDGDGGSTRASQMTRKASFLRSASGGKEMMASWSISSKTLAKGSKWTASVLFSTLGHRVDGVKDGRTIRSESPKSLKWGPKTQSQGDPRRSRG